MTELTVLEKPSFEFIPLLITFSMKSPIMLSYPWICFDGLMAFGIGELLFPDQWSYLPSQTPSPIWDRLPVPLKKLNYNRSFIYYSSISRFESYNSSSIQFHKFFCSEGLNYLKTKKRKFMIVGGEFKQNRKQYPLIPAKECRFYCNGDKKTITKLCNNLIGIGKRVGAGFGHIKKVEIEEIYTDYSLYHPEYGINRPIPLSLKNKFPYKESHQKKAILAVRPPNWVKKNHELCIIPEGINGF